jgi:hypothetical protein
VTNRLKKPFTPENDANSQEGFECLMGMPSWRGPSTCVVTMIQNWRKRIMGRQAGHSCPAGTMLVEQCPTSEGTIAPTYRNITDVAVWAVVASAVA